MIEQAAGERLSGRILENGCGVGMYVQKLSVYGGAVTGLEYDFERSSTARRLGLQIVNAAGEFLPFPDRSFDLVLSHEVLEHVQDDRLAAQEIVRVLRPGGRAVIFVPNRGYLFETHGIYWQGKYHFGNIPLVNYLPRRLRDHLAPHVRVYAKKDLVNLFYRQPVRIVESTTIFGAYDNIIARQPTAGKALRGVLQALERTPLRALGLSLFYVIEKQ